MDPLSGGTYASFKNLDLVFVGHGVSAPELSWDDFKGQQLGESTASRAVSSLDCGDGTGNTVDFIIFFGTFTYI